MKKVLMSFLVGLLCVPVIAHAEDDNFATITDISKEDSVTSGTGESLDVKITGENTSSVLVEYGKNSAIKLKKLDDSVPDRPDNNAWLGINTNIQAIGDISNAKYNKYTYEVKKAEKVKEDDLDFYFPVTEDAIKKAIDEGKEYIEYKYEFDWDGNDTYEQTVTIRIYVQKLEVAPKAGDEKSETWTAEDTKAYQAEVAAQKEEEKDKPASNNKEDKLDDVPKTGDSASILLLAALLLSTVGAVSLKLAYSKK